MPVNMVGNTTYEKGRDGRDHEVPTWKALGFLATPTQVLATGEETLFRVWTTVGNKVKGAKNRFDGDKAGRFFSLSSYASRREAERHSNVMQYGNCVFHQTRYKVKKGTPMWLGKVHPGDYAEKLGYVAGSQVFIDWEHIETDVWEVGEVPILDDMNGAIVHKRDDVPDQFGRRPLDS